MFLQDQISCSDDWDDEHLSTALRDQKRLIPVITFKDENQTLADMTAALASGMDGVFLKSFRPEMAEMMAKRWNQEVETALPNLWLGINFHGYSTLGVTNTLNVTPFTPKAVWLQSQRTMYSDPLREADIARELIQARARKNDLPCPLFFGTLRGKVRGNSMKRVRQIIRRTLRKVDVAVVPIDYEDPLLFMRLSVMRVASGNGLLAFDAEMTPALADKLRNFGDIFLVPASPRERPCDWRKMRELAEIVHAR